MVRAILKQKLARTPNEMMGGLVCSPEGVRCRGSNSTLCSSSRLLSTLVEIIRRNFMQGLVRQSLINFISRTVLSAYAKRGLTLFGWL